LPAFSKLQRFILTPKSTLNVPNGAGLRDLDRVGMVAFTNDAELVICHAGNMARVRAAANRTRISSHFKRTHYPAAAFFDICPRRATGYFLR